MSTITVNDGMDNTLRECLNKGNKLILNNNMKINIHSEFLIKDNVEIDGNGSTLIAKNCRHFNIKKGATLTLKNLILTNGKENFGGSIYSNLPTNTIILNNVEILNNEAMYGGGIFTLGSLIVENSRINNNIAQKQGGGLWCAKNLTLLNSTINNNKVERISNNNFAGGAYVDDGNVALNDSQINNNLVSLNDNNGGYCGGIMINSGS